MKLLQNTAQILAAALAATACATAPGAFAEPASIAPVFENDMVLQRDRPLTVWGTADAGANLTVSLSGQSMPVTADKTGKWSATFEGQSSGPATITLSEDGRLADEITRAVWGDVFLCSGQSNMDFMVQNAANVGAQYDAAERYPIYVARVDRQSSPAPTDTLDWYVDWSPATADSIRSISAVCWHMAYNLAAETGEPVAIVHSAYGGTTIEDWMSPRALTATGEADDLVQLMADYNADPDQTVADTIAATDAWAATYDPGTAGARPWQLDTTPSGNWKPLPVPGLFERAGIEEISNFNGVIWFRKSFSLPDSEAPGAGEISLGRIDERDTVWINGQRVGASIDPASWRVYDIPQGVLKPGKNTVTVRVVDQRGSGGLRGPEEDMVLTAGETAVPLAGTWEYRTGVSIYEAGLLPPTPWIAPRGATTLYNGMIHPLGPLSLKGVVWYQGETNTGEPRDYARQLTALIEDWRDQFGNPDLPFVIVQLPKFGRLTDQPGQSNWAELREDQRKVADAMPGVALVVAIDQGEPYDIHPTHKQAVGDRVAEAMKALAYGKRDAAVSPYPVRVDAVADGAVEVGYADGVELTTLGGTGVPYVQLCDAALSCRYAEARLENNAIRITGVEESDTLVRYAWDDSPYVLLFTRDGLPAAPFEQPLP